MSEKLNIPADDFSRNLTAAQADRGVHIGVVGDAWAVGRHGTGTAPARF